MSWLLRDHYLTPNLSNSLSLAPVSSLNLTKNTVLPGHISVPRLCALTSACIPLASQTPSTIPATQAAQFNWFISLGTLIYVLTKGSLSIIMYSKELVVDCSREEAGREKRTGQSVRVRRVRSGRRRVGRVEGGRDEAEEDVDEELEVEMGRER